MQNDIHAPFAPDEPLYVVGDIHGRADLLDKALEIVDADIEERGNDDALVVFVGDYVDRGEQSAGVLTRLSSLAGQKKYMSLFLMGNHERMMLEFLDQPEELGNRWLRNGGLQTIASFGIAEITEYSGTNEVVKASVAFKEALGPELEKWVRDLPHLYQSGNIVCAHAGLDPKASVEDQTIQSLIWGNSDFLRTARTDGLWVVHGHYAADEAGINDGKISTDTGAWYSDKLTVAAFETDLLRFLST